MRERILDSTQLSQAEEMLENGATNREIARYFGVGKTTIWDNVYRQKKRMRIYNRARFTYLFIPIKSVIIIVNQLRNQGLNSGQVSQDLQIPLEEVNYIYSTYPCSLNIYA